MIRVAVVEDDPRIRAAIVARCRRQAGPTLVGDWESADDAGRDAGWCRCSTCRSCRLPGMSCLWL